jgi:hypothetical protein
MGLERDRLTGQMEYVSIFVDVSTYLDSPEQNFSLTML